MNVVQQPPLVLTIAGSDTSAGAGIQADIKTISACGAYALTAVTALTAQDPDGVQAVWPVSTGQLREQIHCALQFRPHAIKIGMLASAELVDVVADSLAACADIPVVLDTVIRSSSGAELLDHNGIARLRERLLPRATIITPNKQEARILFEESDEAGIQVWSQTHRVTVLETGGDSDLAVAGEPRFCTDIFFNGHTVEHMTLPHIETANHHGTGCTLAAALASFLAHGFPLPEAVQYARQFVHQSLLAAVGHSWPGHGPLNHFFAFDKTLARETV